MKNMIWAMLYLLACSSALAAEEEYAAANLREVEISPKDYRNKKITYTGRYINFSSTFPAYMQSNRFVPDKYLLLEVGSPKMPVIIKKTDEVVKLLVDFRAGILVQVSGKVKEFSIKPPMAILPYYYMLADKVEVVEQTGAPQTGDIPPELPPRKRPGPPFRPRR